MAVYIGHDECQVIYVAKNGQQRRVSSIWVGDQQVFPPANRQEIHAFTRDTQGYGREDNADYYAFSVPVPWWATSVDVVMLGAGEKGRDGTKSFTGGTDGAGGKSGAWKVATTALTSHDTAFVQLPKGNSVSPPPALLYMATPGGEAAIVSTEGGTTTPNNGSTGGTPSPRERNEFANYHVGGYGGTRNNPGNHPGGGGGGGQGSNLLGNPTSGRDGGDGYVWLRFRSAPALTPGDDEFALRVGVSSGYAFTPLHEWAVGIGKTPQTITEITVPMEVVGPSLQLLFYYFQALVSVPDMDTSQVTDMNGMFTGCSSLATIPALDASQVAEVAGMFSACSSLESVTLPGMGNGFTNESAAAFRTLDMRDTKLDAAAANELMQSLGTPTPGGNLQLPSTATGANTSIATAKNWTVTIG